jgi:hypothetical protein
MEKVVVARTINEAIQQHQPYESGVFFFILPFCLIEHAGKIQNRMPGIPSCDSLGMKRI